MNVIDRIHKSMSFEAREDLRPEVLKIVEDICLMKSKDLVKVTAEIKTNGLYEVMEDKGLEPGKSVTQIVKILSSKCLHETISILVLHPPEDTNEELTSKVFETLGRFGETGKFIINEMTNEIMNIINREFVNSMMSKINN